MSPFFFSLTSVTCQFASAQSNVGLLSGKVLWIRLKSIYINGWPLQATFVMLSMGIWFGWHGDGFFFGTHNRRSPLDAEPRQTKWAKRRRQSVSWSRSIYLSFCFRIDWQNSVSGTMSELIVFQRVHQLARWREQQQQQKNELECLARPHPVIRLRKKWRARRLTRPSIPADVSCPCVQCGFSFALLLFFHIWLLLQGVSMLDRIVTFYFVCFFVCLAFFFFSLEGEMIEGPIGVHRLEWCIANFVRVSVCLCVCVAKRQSIDSCLNCSGAILHRPARTRVQIWTIRARCCVDIKVAFSLHADGWQSEMLLFYLFVFYF